MIFYFQEMQSYLCIITIFDNDFLNAQKLDYIIGIIMFKMAQMITLLSGITLLDLITLSVGTNWQKLN